MTIGDWLEIYRQQLPEGEALLLLSFTLHREKTFLLAHPEHILSREEQDILHRCAERRKNHEPLAYITGEKEFFGLPFFVTPSTLIPRPETEILVEHVLDKIREQRTGNNEQGTKEISIIDIGTGSGCIPISIAKTLRSTHPDIFSYTKFIATDISKAALAIAEKNAKRHTLDTNISFLESDLLSELPDTYLQSPSIIITGNLPYLSETIYRSSADDVRLYEPQSALQGDENDGTTLIIALLKQYIEKSIYPAIYFLILEISPEQGTLLLSQGKVFFPQSKVTLLADLSGRNRFLIIQNHS